MRVGLLALSLAVIAAAACAPPDPRLTAAESFRSTVFDLIGKDEAQTARLNALRLGMSDQEVLAAAGSPERRETRTGENGEKVESWTYNGELSTLGTLTFESGKLVDVHTN